MRKKLCAETREHRNKVSIAGEMAQRPMDLVRGAACDKVLEPPCCAAGGWVAPGV